MNTLVRWDRQSFGSIGVEARHYLRLSIATALHDLKLSLSACAWRPMFVDFSSSFRKQRPLLTNLIAREVAPMRSAEPSALKPQRFDLKNPVALFQTWLEEAINSGTKEPTAMTVATVGPDGAPDARMLLLKGCDEGGFVFYTNLESPKAQALRKDPRVALCFFWAALEKQVRIRGRAALVSDEEADAYFATRPRSSQISAWASKQSRTMEGHFVLETEVASAVFRFGIGAVPRPPFWSGFLVVPERIEFWTAKLFRRHHRVLYTRIGEGWQTEWLYP